MIIFILVLVKYVIYFREFKSKFLFDFLSWVIYIPYTLSLITFKDAFSYFHLCWLWPSPMCFLMYLLGQSLWL